MSGGTSAGSTNATTTTGASGETGIDETGFKFDLPVVDSPGESTEGCEKIDFLFVIDNSHSMSQEQQSLIASFDGFVATMQKTLVDAQDYHVMVVDTDAWVFEDCDLFCGLGDDCAPNYDYECDSTEPLECEDVLGAGVVHPRGAEATQADCGLPPGQRYLTSDDPALLDKFACAARVGIGATGEPERPLEALVDAVDAASEASTCNAGFLRQDAILVATFVTDEDDDAGDGSSGDPASWRQALIAAKGGDETAIVTLGLYGHDGCAETSPRLDAFVESFGQHGFSGSVCAPSYDSFFAEAVAIIATTCDEFVPEG